MNAPEGVATHVDGAHQDSATLAAQIATQVEALREDCLSHPGRGATLRALHLCLLHDLPVPAWLRLQFNRRFLMVAAAEVASFDEAFGRYWPAHTRLHVERSRHREMRAVHAAVFELVMVRADGATKAIGKGLFEEVGALKQLNVSGSKAERLYYEAVASGLPNVAELRRAALGDANPQ